MVRSASANGKAFSDMIIKPKGLDSRQHTDGVRGVRFRVVIYLRGCVGDGSGGEYRGLCASPIFLEKCYVKLSEIGGDAVSSPRSHRRLRNHPSRSSEFSALFANSPSF